MDVRNYYSQVREVAEQIPEEFVVVVSSKTEDGGRSGVMSEVRRQAAARLVVEGRATLATPEQAEAFREQVKNEYEKLKAAEEKRRAALETYSIAGMDAVRKMWDHRE